MHTWPPAASCLEVAGHGKGQNRPAGERVIEDLRVGSGIDRVDGLLC